ncbi:MAG TPA: MurR/RpiR family transcriptional regulator [Beijerinckiaceae bacterium]
MKNPVHASAEGAFRASQLGGALASLSETGSPANRALAGYLLRNPVRVAAWSIEDLAGETGVSTATISRFARAAGHRGFPEMRAAVAETLQSILHPVEKLRDAVERPAPGGALPEAVSAVLENVHAAADGLARAPIAGIAREIMEARGVYVMGFGLSAHLAGLLTLGLQPFCPQLVNVVEFGGTEVAAGRLMNVGRGDVLVALSFPRYARDAVQLSAYARDRGATVTAITDGPSSPLVPLARNLIFAPASHPVLSSSITAAALAVEALVASLMVSRRDNVGQAAKLTEAISSYLYGTEAAETQPRQSRPEGRRRR